MFLIIIFWVFAVVLSLSNLVMWIIHITESPFDQKHGWCGYRKFSKHFSNYNWRYENYRGFIGFDSEEGRSYYSDHKSHIKFGDKIKFDGIYMVINNPISYGFVNLRLLREKKKFRKKTVLHKW